MGNCSVRLHTSRSYKLVRVRVWDQITVTVGFDILVEAQGTLFIWWALVHVWQEIGWCIFESVGAKHLQVEGVDMDDSNVACCCNGGELGWDVGECSL